jgi:hypothetical protein
LKLLLPDFYPFVSLFLLIINTTQQRVTFFFFFGLPGEEEEEEEEEFFISVGGTQYKYDINSRNTVPRL